MTTAKCIHKARKVGICVHFARQEVASILDLELQIEITSDPYYRLSVPCVIPCPLFSLFLICREGPLFELKPIYIKLVLSPQYIEIRVALWCLHIFPIE